MNGGYKGLHPQRPRIRVGGVNRRGSASRGLWVHISHKSIWKEVSDSLQCSGPREFDESEDMMFEREFEDTEFE